MAASRLSKPGWKILGLALVVGLVGVGGPRLMSRLAFFRVRRVAVEGARNLRAAELAALLPIRPGQSLFEDLDPVRAVLDTVAGIATLAVGRRFPGTITVTIQEAEPVAYVMRRGALRMIGARGEALRFDPTVAAPDLPLVREADSVVTRFLVRVRSTDPTFHARIVSAWRSGEDVVLSLERQRYWFRPDAGAEVIRAVTAVEQELESNGQTWVELDARFADQIVVRTGAG